MIFIHVCQLKKSGPIRIVLYSLYRNKHGFFNLIIICFKLELTTYIGFFTGAYACEISKANS